MHALEHFARRLEVETDVADVAAAMEADEVDFVLVETVAELPDGPVVAYCWGPACNGACKAALRLAQLGRPVKEMLGGYEYWARDGHPIQTS